MKVTIAIDSLKGSLSSLEAGHAIESGINVYFRMQKLQSAHLLTVVKVQ